MLLNVRLVLCAFALLLAPAPASSDEGTDGFDGFCREWMQKLEARERANLASAKFSVLGAEFVAEYTGYAKEWVRCESRVKKAGKPGVGVLVYYEIRYRRAGADPGTARAAEPSIVERLEVTEVFRYDGRRWAY